MISVVSNVTYDCRYGRYAAQTAVTTFPSTHRLIRYIADYKARKVNAENGENYFH